MRVVGLLMVCDGKLVMQRNWVLLEAYSRLGSGCVA
jgi:hypothetical protein